jgi:hypothetical protein
MVCALIMSRSLMFSHRLPSRSISAFSYATRATDNADGSVVPIRGQQSLL